MEPKSHKIIPTILGAIFVLVPLSYSSLLRDHTLGPKLLIFQILITVILGIWILSTRSLQLSLLVLPALLYVLTGLASTFYATHPTLSILEGTKQLTGFLFFLILSNHLTPQNIRYVLTFSLATGALIALLGIADYLGWRPLNIPSSGLPSATLGFRNIAAMYLIQSLPFVVALFALSKTKQMAYISGLTIALMSAFLIYTRTRGAWVGVLGGICITTLLWWPHLVPKYREAFAQKKWPLLLGTGAFIVLMFLPSGLIKRGPQSIDEKKTTISAAVTSIVEKDGDRGRLSIWRHTLPMIADYPIGGVGKGNWQIHYPHYDGGNNITFGAAPERPHNHWLQIFAETGAMGLFFFFWLCLAVIHTGWQHLKTASSQTQWLSAACLVSFTAILIHSFFSFPLERITPTLFFWAMPGLLVALSPPSKSLKPAWSTLILVILLGISALQIAFTYRLIQFDKHMYHAVQAERQSAWRPVIAQTESAQHYGFFHQEATHLRGFALNIEGLYKKSLEFYNAVIHLTPHDVQALNGLAIAEQNIGQIDKAEAHYQAALNLTDSPDIRYNLATLYLQSGRAKQAIVEFERLMQTETPSLDVYHHLIHAYLFARQPHKTPAIMQQALNYSPVVESHVKWIEHLYLKHRKTEIIRLCYTLLIDLWPGPPDQIKLAQKRLDQLKMQP